MGRRNKAYSKDLRQQMHERLEAMLHRGEGQSKKEAVANGTVKDKIFSYGSYDTYRKQCGYFIDYMRQAHPECTTIRSAQKYMNEWLQSQTDRKKEDGTPYYSAWTISTRAQALNKLYGIAGDDPNRFRSPQRHRQDIKRSRGDAERDKHFSVTNNDEYIKFCSGTGCRKEIVKKLRGSDLYSKAELMAKQAYLQGKQDRTKAEESDLTAVKDGLENFPDQEYFLHHRTDKGGRDRYAPIVGKNADKIVERMKDTPSAEKVWKHVPTNADTHSYRGEYAIAIYRIYARPIEEIPYDAVNKGTGKPYQSGVYHCRKDEKGKELDKDAMEKASKALGHNRLEIVANNYIRGL